MKGGNSGNTGAEGSRQEKCVRWQKGAWEFLVWEDAEKSSSGENVLGEFLNVLRFESGVFYVAECLFVHDCKRSGRVKSLIYQPSYSESVYWKERERAKERRSPKRAEMSGNQGISTSKKVVLFCRGLMGKSDWNIEDLLGCTLIFSNFGMTTTLGQIDQPCPPLLTDVMWLCFVAKKASWRYLCQLLLEGRYVHGRALWDGESWSQ